MPIDHNGTGAKECHGHVIGQTIRDQQMRTTTTSRCQVRGGKVKLCLILRYHSGEPCNSCSQEAERAFDALLQNALGAVPWQNDMI